MQYETISINTNDKGIASLSLNREHKRNALNEQMIAELHDVGDKLAVDESIRIIVLTGGESVFCAGGDLNWMKAQFEASDEQRRLQAKALAMMLYRLNTLPQTIIAKIHADAYGGGVGLISISDIAIASSRAKFALTELKLGLIPATIGPYVHARIGPSASRKWFLNAQTISAEQAKDIGLLHSVVDIDALDTAVDEEIDRLLLCSPQASAMAKNLLANMNRPVINESLIDETIDQLVKCWNSEQTKQGIAAFFAKQKAPWII